jgi:signal transduction histidine kinase
VETVRALLNWRSQRWKIALLVAAACGAIALTVGVLVHRSTYERSMDVDAAQAYSALQTALAADRGSTASRLIADPGEMPPDLVRMVRARGNAAFYDDSHPVRPQMWAAQALPDGRMAAAFVDVTPDLLSRMALDRHMWKYSLVALAVIVPLSALAAELPNRRLRRVARTARRIAGGDLDARTRVRGRAGDEITEISATVDSMADSLRDRLLSEQRFTADVAPELRTPLMGLVINAHRHGKPPVEVTVDATTVVVRDHGAGFPDRLLAEGPQRFHTSAAERGRGHGLGLTVAAGQARVIGASLAFSNAADGGGVVTLRLPSTH